MKMRKKFFFYFRGIVAALATFFLFLPPARAEVSLSEFQALKKTIEELRQQIGIQGEEIASLKNQLAAIAEKPTPGHIVPKDQESLRKSVSEVLEDIRLSGKQETPEDKALRTIYDDGFYLKGKDDTLKISGWYQGDLTFYDRENEANNRFRNRRARLDVRGVLEDYFEYRLYTQFAGSAANLQEAWLAYKYFPNLRVKFGQFKVPFSLESQHSALWTDFLERSIGVTNLQPAEDLGLMFYGNPFGGVIEYGMGVFNGRLRTSDDNNDNLDIAGRLVLAPFKKLQTEILKDFYAGGSVTLGHSDESLAGTGFTTAGGSRFFTYSSAARHANTRTRLGGELQWIYGPGDIKAEYVAGRFSDVERGILRSDVDVDSWYVSGSYVITGERKIRNKWLKPRKPFSIQDRHWGAWEIASRFEQFFTQESPLILGLATGVDRVDAYTLGLNWWPNKHIRLMFNYVLNDFSDGVSLGGEPQSSEHLWLSRVQYHF